MLTSLVVNIVDFSRRFAVGIVVLSLIIATGLGLYVVYNFKINTDINQLISGNFDWRKREKILEKAFPQKTDVTLIVIDGDTPDAAENAASALAGRLKQMPDRFSLIERPDAIPFFAKNGLLFLPKEEISATLNKMIEAQPILGSLSTDPSLRGFFGTISLMLQGVQAGQIPYERLDQPLNTIADTVEAAMQGQDRPLAWQSMAALDKAPTLRDTRKFIIAKPILDYNALQPGEASSTAVRELVQELQLTPDHGVHVRLTGSVPLNDEEFASVAEGNKTATFMSAVLVFVILLIALRSLRIVLPILLTLGVGLVCTTAFALLFIGSFNLISVAFAVMFIGIAVDFGIQFGVRYRDQHHQEPDSIKAMTRTAAAIAIPLAMAAGSTSLGFFAFIPTAYRGVSELGMIAGMGMLIAFALNITLLPALLTLTHPPAEPEAVGYRGAAPIDRFLVQRRKLVLTLACIAGLLGVLIITQLRFDFDPLNLKNPHTESVSTLFDLMHDPDFNSYTIDILRPSLQDTQDLAGQLQKLPEVDHVMTLASFVPQDQAAKLALINDANMILSPALNLPQQPAPSDDDNLIALQKTANALQPFAQDHPSAARLAKSLGDVAAKHDPLMLQRLTKNIVDVMQSKLGRATQAMSAEQVTPDNITDDLKHDWVTPDGQYLVQVYPRGDARLHATQVAFVQAVRGVAPDAGGAPISVQESGKVVTHAFIHAGLYALIAIGLLAFLVLRRILDVVILITPLILAGVLTLATIVLIGLPLNFANIIALPMLLSLGVSYAIYFVSYWRAGLENPLQSSMARAVLFSAATVLVAFGSLALSLHPGTSGMGKLLTVALLYSLLSTFLVLPALCACNLCRANKSDKA